MTVMGFSSFEEMQEYMRKAAQQANEGLHPQQRAIAYGDHWVQFADMGELIVIFGRVHTLEEIRQGEQRSGATPSEADEVAASTAADLDQGYMFGTAYSVIEPTGELGTTHKASVWPIEERLFNAARQAEWNISELDEASKVLLTIAHAAFVAHKRSLG